ncbi:DNA cytosine methyltransferase [Hydrogenovibrio sp. 3SP14C1]|uniref:DNA cytosine methyltransferase n=1 Tax=Hydrogenovibrio sp. 3SP14C1 TaxID=3038774 RepID=UPI0024163DF7|nr:DNA cytosine methyltransferase [Hydrogenovibrio sp. 3SP14C1]MDG4811899.1 DNA cytosine methyltransferase [Hydrogenovibrio sp. 3SP14C1]
MYKRTINHFHLFCGLGGGAKGFNMGQAKVGQIEAEFRCIGGIDSDAAAIQDFNQLAGAKGTVMDLFDAPQYLDWHGHLPPEDWKEATPEDIRRAAGYERPNIVFTSPPCKGFSGLLSQTKSGTDKYQALNRLTTRGIKLALEAWQDDPVEFFILENVPRIATRGRYLIDEIIELLESHGYAVAETTHDCGEIGGLAQSRKRFLLVARHQEKIPPFLYEPETKSLKKVGDILENLPMPGDESAGPMHRIPNLQWKTWVRLAFVEAGKDWRSLQNLNVQNGFLTDFGIMPNEQYHNSVYGVKKWEEPTGTVAGRSTPSNGAYSVADPRWTGTHKYGQLGVRNFDETSGAVSGQSAVGGGRYAIADPRINGERHKNVFKVVQMDGHSPTVTSGTGPTAGGLTIADPRMPDTNKNRHNGFYRVVDFNGQAHTVTGAKHVAGTATSVADPRGGKFGGKYSVTDFDKHAKTVISGSTTGQGAFAVADPRPGLGKDGNREHYQTAGHYGVRPWDSHSYAVPGKAKLDRGPWSVADPRIQDAENFNLPSEKDKGAFIIQSLDNTWHRPFTTLELAALQGLVDPEEFLHLFGGSDSAWRERIGNAVPAPTAAAIASVMGQTILLAEAGETFMLSAMPIWVQPLVVSASVENQNWATI